MVADLHLKLVDSQEKIKSKNNIISSLNHQLFVLKNATFGRKIEKLEQDKQLDLGFDEAEPEKTTEIKNCHSQKEKTGAQVLT